MNERKRHPFRFVTCFISLVLVFALLSSSYGTIFAETAVYGSTYVSEVRVFEGDSLNDAVQKCRSAGYIPVENNINRAADGDSTDNGIYIVGYKTTDNADESITGISMLQMNSGYQDCTYGTIAERAVEKLGNVPAEIFDAVTEFAENYAKGSPAAQAAASALNCFYIDEENGKKLGDYIVEGSCTLDFIKKLLSRANTSVVSAFCNALVAGVADYGEDKWATRLYNSSVKTALEDPDNNAQLDVCYKVAAKELTDSLQAFAKGYTEAALRYEETGTLTGTAAESDPTEIPQETVLSKINGEQTESTDGDFYFLYAYEVLNTFNYDDTTKLGDYIVSLGSSTFDDIDSLRKVYPLADSLTDGQLAAMRLSGVAFSAVYLVNESGVMDETKKQIDALKQKLSDNTGSESMSVWVGTDQSVFNQKVAVTSEAYRQNSAGQIYNTLTSPDALDTFTASALTTLEIIMSVVGIGFGITYLTSVVVNATMFAVFAGSSLSIWAVCCLGIGSGVFSTIFGLLGCAFVILNYVTFVAMIVLLVVMLVKYLWDKFTDDDAEDFTQIPPVVFDSAQNRYVKYEAVRMDGSPANINGENARRWNALYTTKSTYVGNPICSSELEDLITVRYNDNTVPQGYKAVKCFGEVVAANLNANSKSDSLAVYMFCKNTPNKINEGTSETDDGTDSEDAALYISKLSLSVESSETAAKAALTKSGYNIFDINLTPSAASAKKYTYVGFTTTTNPNDAVTDIRVSARDLSQTYFFGNASYTSCGTTATGDTLYYTSYKSAGSPILADITVKYSLNDIPTDGYEPINMFGGGYAFNFNVGSETENSTTVAHRAQPYDQWNNDGIYLYFKPSVTYTEGEEYISGLVLVAGHAKGKLNNTADDYISALKLKKFAPSLTHAAKITLYSTDFTVEDTLEDVETYICYSTTHNPYRAIYGIGSYTSAPDNYTVPTFLGSTESGAYAVCNVLFELPYFVAGGTDTKKTAYMRGIYESHSYMFAPCSGETTGIRQQTPVISVAPEEYEDVDWTSCGTRGKGIYVLGPVEGGTPLTVDDIAVTESSAAPDGFVSVQDFKTPNRTEPHNLGFSTTVQKCISSGEKLTPVYIYVKKATPVEKKYISSITVATYSIDETGVDLSKLNAGQRADINAHGTDYCVQQLLMSCTDEIIEVNLARDRASSLQGDDDAKPDTVSYIGVTRTDSSLQAITGIIKYMTDSKTAAPSIRVGGLTYIKAGDRINDPNGSYYLYYTYSDGASPGMPITSISAGARVFEASCATVMSANSVDSSSTSGTAEKAALYGDSKASVFIHVEYEESVSAMGTIYVGHGKTEKEAQANLLSLGCNFCVDLDLNRGTGGEYVYIGYSKYKLKTTELRKGVARYAVRDILITVGLPHQKSFIYNGLKYDSAVDEFTKSTDGQEAVSLNYGAGGKQIYLYFTTAATDETAYPIAKLGAACADYGMINDDMNRWENIYDINGSRVNLNEGAISTVDGGLHISDNRIYLYASRTENAVKDGCGVDTDRIEDAFTFYDVYMKGGA